MPSGPLGGPRPAASAHVELIMPLSPSKGISESQATRRIGSILDSSVIISTVGSGAVDVPVDNEKAVIVSTREDDLRFEQIEAVFEYLTTASGQVEDRNYWYITSSEPTGVVGTPRPFTRSTIALHFHSNDEFAAVDELAMEAVIRNRMEVLVEAVEWEGMKHAGRSMTIMKETDKMQFSEAKYIEKLVNQQFDETLALSSSNVTVV